eukprot:1188216-Prorocentrum_minimum.AAC.1
MATAAARTATTAAVVAARTRDQDENIDTRRTLLSGGNTRGFSRYIKRPSECNSKSPFVKNEVSVVGSPPVGWRIANLRWGGVFY